MQIKTQLNVTTTEFQDLSTQLAETNIILVVLEKLAKIHNHLETVDSSVDAHEYTVAVRNLNAVNQLLETEVIMQEKQVHIVGALHQCYLVREEKLRCDISEAWSELVHWTIPKEDSNGSIKTKSRKVVLQIGTQQKQKDVLADTVQALSDMGDLTPKMKVLGQRILQYLVGPLLDDPGACLQVDAETRTLIMDRKSITDQPQPVPPKTALKNVCDVFLRLNDDLLGLEVNVPVAGQKAKKRLMAVLGECTQVDFQDMVINRCLAHSVPSSNKELEDYQSNVVSVTKTMQNALIELDFLCQDNMVLMDFVSKVDILFANKKTQEILEKARCLMTSDIHNMVKISIDLPSVDLPPLELEGASAKKARQSEQLTRPDGVQLSPNTFRMPTCHIRYAIHS